MTVVSSEGESGFAQEGLDLSGSVSAFNVFLSELAVSFAIPLETRDYKASTSRLRIEGRLQYERQARLMSCGRPAPPVL